MFQKTNTTESIRLALSTKRTASVLIIVMIIISILATLSINLASRQRTQMKITAAYIDSVKAHYFALGGIERAKILIIEQPLSPARIKNICEFNKDASDESLLPMRKNLNYSIRDEKSFFPIKKSNPQVWLIFETIKQSIAKSIIDWIDSDDIADLDGAETDYYMQNNLGYSCKNRNIESLRELMYIRGVDYDRYLGIDGSVGLMNFFSPLDNIQMNINTTPARIIENLPGLSANVAARIDFYRKTNESASFENAQDFSKLPELSQMEIELLTQYFTYTTDHFRIYSHANINGYECEYMTTVKKTGLQIETVSIERIK